MRDVPQTEPSRQTVGEPYVWFTGMGLALGLLMVIFLLGLILANGFRTFWPKPVTLLTLRDESSARLKQSATVAGEVVKQRAKVVRTIQPESSAADQPNSQAEWQLFLGNKDAYGLSFLYVDQDDITQVETPPDWVVIERLEYGDAIGLPAALEISGGQTILATQPTFKDQFHARVEEVNARWEAIRQIEKFEIGAINGQMEKLRRRLRGLNRSQDIDETERDARQQPLQANMGELQAAYETLAAQARALRQQQTEDTLIYRLATGEERRLPVGQIVHYYYPNQLTTWQRWQLFGRNIWAFLSHEPREANTEGGVFPAIFGTCVMTILMSLAVTPFGVVAAIYLREYAKQGFIVRAVRIAVNNLAGVPSIVFGVFGLGFFVYLVGGTIDDLLFSSTLPTPTFGTGGILWASLTLALMTVPVVIVATEEALAAVPRGMREGSLACGASKWQTMQRIVIPAAAPRYFNRLNFSHGTGGGRSRAPDARWRRQARAQLANRFIVPVYSYGTKIHASRFPYL